METLPHRSIIREIYQIDGRKFDFAAGGKLSVYNIGCGARRYPGIIGVDWSDAKEVDVKHNLEKHPWPIADNAADVVLSFHTLEHLTDLYGAMREIHRIGKPGARVVIEVPYFRSPAAFKDPTHVRFFTSKTFDYFCKPNHTYPNSPFMFKLVECSLGWPAAHAGPVKRFVKRWLSAHRNFYDDRLAPFFAVKILVVELEVVK